MRRDSQRSECHGWTCRRPPPLPLVRAIRLPHAEKAAHAGPQSPRTETRFAMNTCVTRYLPGMANPFHPRARLITPPRLPEAPYSRTPQPHGLDGTDTVFHWSCLPGAETREEVQQGSGQGTLDWPLPREDRVTRATTTPGRQLGAERTASEQQRERRSADRRGNTGVQAPACHQARSVIPRPGDLHTPCPVPWETVQSAQKGRAGRRGEMESSSRAVSTHTDRLPNAGEPPPDAFRILTTLSNIYTSRFQGVHPHSEKCKIVCFAYAFGYFPTAGCKHFILILNCSPSASAHVSDGVLLFRVEVVLLPNQSPFESQSAERVTSSLRGDTTAKGMNATPAGDKDVAPTPTPPEQRHTEQRELPAVRPAAPAAQRSHRTRGQHQ